jgi:hypothetical protein
MTVAVGGPGTVATRWDRGAALGGVAFVVLDLIVAVLGGEPPSVDTSASELATYYDDKGAAIEAGLWLFGLGVVALIWWSTALWRWMTTTGDGESGAAAASLLGLGVAGALSLAAATMSATLALHIDGIGDDLTTLHAFGALLSTASGIGLAAHLLATNLLGSAPQRLPGWLVAVGVVSALAWLLQAVAGATSTGGAASSIGLAAFLLWCTWILGISHHLWSESARVPDRVSS